MSVELTPAQALGLAREAYLFGLPLVYIDTQVGVLTHVVKPEGSRAPLNQFAHFREFPDASNKTIVGFNVDTLYSLAQLNVSSEPIVLAVPEMGDRYWIVQVIDGWNNVPHAPGSRTVGGKGGTFALTGPGWHGGLPDGVVELPMPTGIALLGGRIYTGGPDDYDAVHALQDQFKLVPLSAWDIGYTPPAEVPLKPDVEDKPVPAQVTAMSPETYFNRLNALLVTNPPEPDDAELIARLAVLGVGPGLTFSMDSFDDDVRSAIEQGVTDARQAILDEESKLGERVNGWNLSRDLGRYGTRYTYRAAWTWFGVGGNLIEDAFYPLSLVDGDGQLYDSANRYALHFAREQLPPVDAFWSITMYDTDSYLVDNPIDRYALGDRSHLTFADDGSLTILIQSESPGQDAASNWLPAPTVGGFKLALRLYAPKPEVLDGSWTPPPVERNA
jgi:hypothetical protein